MKFCIVGYPVRHSISPRLYNEYFRLLNMPHFYDFAEIAPDVFDEEIKRVLSECDGFNVTIPHKERIIPYVEPTKEATKIQAVNCVHGRKGYNTDWIGVLMSLEGTSVEEPVLVIGAGGTARALLYALLEMGIRDITVTNRTLDRAKSLGFPVKVVPFERLKESVRNSKSLFNTTSVGMRGERFDLSEEDLANLSLVYDVIYFETPLLDLARRAGVRHVVRGNLMFYYQAMENLKIWGLYDDETFKKVFGEVLS